MAVFPLAGQNGNTNPLYPAGSASPDYKAAGFIPDIWSSKLIEKFYPNTVLSSISNTDYEGEIKSKGDTVIIRTKPTITIHDYSEGTDLTIDRPVGSETNLQINKGKYFSTILDNVLEVQSDLDQLSLWADDAAQQMKIKIDTDVLGGILHQGDAGNRGVTAGVITGGINLGVTGTPIQMVARNATGSAVEVTDVLMRLGQALDEQNIPEEGRWVVLPAWAANQIKRSELRAVWVSGDDVSMLRNGRLGKIDKFTIFSSNLLPFGVAAGLAAPEYAIYAGHAHGLTFASQITNVETLPSERTFGKILRGLQVYGYKVLDGKALAETIVVNAG